MSMSDGGNVFTDVAKVNGRRMLALPMAMMLKLLGLPV